MASKKDLEARIAALEAEIAQLRLQVAQKQPGITIAPWYVPYPNGWYPGQIYSVPGIKGLTSYSSTHSPKTAVSTIVGGDNPSMDRVMAAQQQQATATNYG